MTTNEGHEQIYTNYYWFLKAKQLFFVYFQAPNVELNFFFQEIQV